MHIKVWHAARIENRGRRRFHNENYSKIYDHRRAERSHYKNTKPIHFHKDTMLHCLVHAVYTQCDCTPYSRKFITESSEEKLSVLKMKIYIPSFSFKCGYICLFWHGNPFLRWSKKNWNETRADRREMSSTLLYSRRCQKKFVT